MLIDQIKKANIEALKAHDVDSRSAYSAVITAYQTFATSGKVEKVEDSDVLRIIQKVSKELEEEKEVYVKGGRTDSAAHIEKQKEALNAFLPKMLSEDEIRSIVASLPDKSMPVIMKYFKENYPGACDMGLVSKIARGL